MIRQHYGAYQVRQRNHSRRNTKPGSERVVETEYQVVQNRKIVSRHVNLFHAEQDAKARNQADWDAIRATRGNYDLGS